MFRFIPFTLKTLWRHRSRTLLTVTGSAIALFVFCFVGAVQEGMNDMQIRQKEKNSLVVFQANKFCPATSHLPEDYSEKIEKLDGVRDVIPIQVFTNNCRASLDVVVFYGVPPEKVNQTRDFQLVSGDWIEFEKHQDAAMVGKSVANRRGLKIGDNFSIGSIKVNIAGIFSSEDPAEENYIYTHLEFLQRRKGRDVVGTVTQIEVLLDPSVDAESKCKEIDLLLKGGPAETDTRPKGVFQAKALGDLTQLISMTHYLGYACVGLVLALVATTTVMSIQDRIKEHAVLQTLGFTGFKVFSLVMAESVILSLAGGIGGVGAAMIMLKFTSLSVSAEAVSIAFTPSINLAQTGILISIITGVIAGLGPAIHAARTEIVPALRQA